MQLTASLDYQVVSFVSDEYDDISNVATLPYHFEVEAPTGMKVVGGGFAGTYPMDGIIYSRPSSTGSKWEVGGSPNGFLNGRVTVYAICVSA